MRGVRTRLRSSSELKEVKEKKMALIVNDEWISPFFFFPRVHSNSCQPRRVIDVRVFMLAKCIKGVQTEKRETNGIHVQLKARCSLHNPYSTNSRRVIVNLRRCNFVAIQIHSAIVSRILFLSTNKKNGIELVTNKGSKKAWNESAKENCQCLRWIMILTRIFSEWKF